MKVYGLYLEDLGAGDLLWFTVDDALAPGRYVRGKHKATSPDVYIAESIPALILEVGSLIHEAEKNAEPSVWANKLPPAARQRRLNDMTEGLMQSLTETSSIWVENPNWVAELQPFVE